MGPLPNKSAMRDPALAFFRERLLAERNASEHTQNAYLSDLAQLVSSKWGSDCEPPFDWTAFNEEDARRFTVLFRYRKIFAPKPLKIRYGFKAAFPFL